MLRLVTTNNVEVFRHIGSTTFQRLGVEHTVAASYEEALGTIARVLPHVAIIDVELAGGSGFDLCRAIKADDSLRQIHVILLLSSVLTRTDFEQIESSGCDDVLALPIQTDEFYHHIAQLAGLPVRRNHRVGVIIELRLAGSAEPVMGTVFNISAGGVGVQVPIKLEEGMELTVRFRHDGEVSPDTPASVSWVKTSAAQKELVAGLGFLGEMPAKTRIMLDNLVLFDVSPAPDDSPAAGGVSVALQGDFNELTGFDNLAERLANEAKIDFNAASVRYISSAGVRSWCQFVAGLAGKRYVFRHCSIAFASQAAMVPMVIGEGDVLSLEAPYLCESCDREEVRLLETKALLRDGTQIKPPLLTCNSCGGELAFDDVPARYFAFLTGSAAKK